MRLNYKFQHAVLHGIADKLRNVRLFAIISAGFLGLVSGCSLLGLADGAENTTPADSLAQLLGNQLGQQKTNQRVSAASIYGEKGIILYDPLGNGTDFVLDPSGRIVKSDLDAAETGLEINDLERRFFRSNKHLIDAESLFYSGLYEEALNETKASIELTPRSAKAYAIKGSLEYKLGRLERARAAWMVALKLDPKMKSVSRALYLTSIPDANQRIAATSGSTDSAVVVGGGTEQ